MTKADGEEKIKGVKGKPKIHGNKQMHIGARHESTVTGIYCILYA